jgi:hypothetical protein
MSISERENTLRILTRSGYPEWIPTTDKCLKTVFSSAVRERPNFGESGDDWFGCHWIFDKDSLGHAPDHYQPVLLDDITKWREVVKIPDLDAIDWQTVAKKDLEGYDRDKLVLRLFMESGPFERSHHILGFENAFIAMSQEPEEYKALIDAIADYKVKLIEKIAQFYAPDEIFFQDDLGSAQGPMMSMDMYRRLLKPAHKRIGETMRKHNIIYTHHSCGKMDAFIDEFLDNGVQVLNPLQPMNDWLAIITKYAGRVSFAVGIDKYINLPDASEENIRVEIRQVIDTFGPTKSLVTHLFISNAACIPRNQEIAMDELVNYGKSFYNRSLS